MVHMINLEVNTPETHFALGSFVLLNICNSPSSYSPSPRARPLSWPPLLTLWLLRCINNATPREPRRRVAGISKSTLALHTPRHTRSSLQSIHPVPPAEAASSSPGNSGSQGLGTLIIAHTYCDRVPATPQSAPALHTHPSSRVSELYPRSGPSLHTPSSRSQQPDRGNP